MTLLSRLQDAPVGLVHSGLTASIPSGQTEQPAASVRERPMLFSGPMVRALLNGHKTQTRRIVKREALAWLEDSGFIPAFVADPDNGLCPYGRPGDRLWVKETWRPRASVQPWDLDVTYHADEQVRTIKDGEFGERDWTMPKAAAIGNVSPLFMPRWASRLTLAITDIRIERLNDCTEADAKAEGSQEPALVPIIGACWSERDAYAKLWEHINGPGSWFANPWVWVLTFDVIPADDGSQAGTERSGVNQESPAIAAKEGT